MLSNVFAYFAYAPKRVLLVALALLAVSIPAMVMAIGEERPTLVYNGPGTPGAEYVVFNSFTGTNRVGDERNFYHGMNAESNGQFQDPVTNLEDGDEVLVRVYVHNNADSSLNANGDGIAKDTTVRVELPEGLAKSHSSTAYISASNAKPQIISDDLAFSTASGGFFELDYVPGSATLLTNFQDVALSDDIVNGGVLIGDDALDGELPGCFDFTAFVTFKVKVSVPAYEIQKEVRTEGQTSADWGDTTNAQPGDVVEWLIGFDNKGSTELSHVVIQDDLPALHEYVPSSTIVFNSANPDGRTLPDGIAGDGIDIGTYQPGANAYVFFQSRISDVEELQCGDHLMRNIAYAGPSGLDPVSDGAEVVINTGVACAQSFVDCTGLTTSILDEGARRVSAEASISKSDDVEIVEISYNFGDSTVVTVSNGAAEHTYSEAGDYDITATISYREGGSEGEIKTITCGDDVDFDPEETPEQITVCRDGVVVTIDADDKQAGDLEGKTCPTALPETGAASVITALIGTGSLAAATRSWLVSRGNLKDAFLS